MNIKTIITDEDHKNTSSRVGKLWNAKENSADAEDLDLLVNLISDYEEKNFPIEKVLSQNFPEIKIYLFSKHNYPANAINCS